MDCSLCASCGTLNTFETVIVHTNMLRLPSANSGSEDEGQQPAAASTSTPQKADRPIDNTSDTDKKSSRNGLLNKVLEAVRNSPISDNQKGVSIQKIKQYLRETHRIRKAQMTEQLKPAMEEALRRQLLIKTTGRPGVAMTGSVKLNPANEPESSDSESTEEEEEEKEDEPEQLAEQTRKKRKATAAEEDDVRPVTRKRVKA